MIVLQAFPVLLVVVITSSHLSIILSNILVPDLVVLLLKRVVHILFLVCFIEDLINLLYQKKYYVLQRLRIFWIPPTISLQIEL